MPRLNYDEIIALSEDPNVTANDLPHGRPLTPTEINDLAEGAARLFFDSSLEDQIAVTRCLPAGNSAEMLTRMPEADRSRILEQLPTRLAHDIAILLPAVVS